VRQRNRRRVGHQCIVPHPYCRIVCLQGCGIGCSLVEQDVLDIDIADIIELGIVEGRAPIVHFDTGYGVANGEVLDGYTLDIDAALVNRDIWE